MKKKIALLLLLVLLLALALTTCRNPGYSVESHNDLFGSFGWNTADDDISNIPVDITPIDDNLPASVSLERWFPPIGDQNPYGTCAAWAVGYNAKTALNAMDRNWTTSQLAMPANQTSPADLWMATPNDGINKDPKMTCEGASITHVVEALWNYGAKSMAQVPYSAISCTRTSSGDPNNRIGYARLAAYSATYAIYFSNDGRAFNMNADAIKTHLTNGKPVVIGGRLGNRMVNWKSSAVLTSDNKVDTMGHAMAVSGYDDSKKAFRIRNSWTTGWGDNGSYWAGYDYFINTLLDYAVVMTNDTDFFYAPPVSYPSSPHDLLAANAADLQDPESDDPLDRAVTYDILNNGTSAVRAGQRWRVYYMYVKANNANDYGILAEHYFTDQFGSPGQSGAYSSSAAQSGVWTHADIAPDRKAMEGEFPGGFYISYRMPEITGKYHLLLYIDPDGAIEETDEANNLFFIAGPDGKALEFEGGIMLSAPVPPANEPSALGKSIDRRVAPAASLAQLGNRNGYTQAEITLVLNRDKKNGSFAKKAAERRDNNNAVKIKPMKGE